MLAYLGTIWKSRYFWLSLVKIDLRARYRGSVLGLGWSLLHPIAMTAILCLVFSKLFKMELCFYAPYLMSGLTLWLYLLQVSMFGAQCFFAAEVYIRQHPAPLAIYPLRTMLGLAFHLMVGVVLVVLLTFLVRGPVGFLPLLSLMPSLVLLLFLGWALATVFGLMNVRFRDTNYLSELGFQILFYLTPIFYDQKILEDRGLDVLLKCNPVVPFLDLVRHPLLYNEVPALATYGWAVLFVCLIVGLAAAALKREEQRLIFHL